MNTLPRRYTGVPGFDVSDSPPWHKPAPDRSLLNNHEFLSDCSRYLEGILNRQEVKKRWRNIDDATWDLLGDDNELVDAIERTRSLRIRDGSCKREKAQQLIVNGPQILSDIATRPGANDKHKVDAIKALDSLTGNPAEVTQQDRIVIRIDLGADIRASGGTPGPADVIEFEAVKPNQNTTIDSTAQEIPYQQEPLPPPRRGPGRPPGSKNKPKVTDDDDGE